MHRICLIIALTLIQLPAFPQGSHKDKNPKSLDFRYAPPEWQSAICLPDDPHKSLVDKSGELLYHYQQGGREFGTRVSVIVDESATWTSQTPFSGRVPIIITMANRPGIQIRQEAFAGIKVTTPDQSDNQLVRTDNGSYLQNWADPAPELEPSLRTIAVHMNGSIQYQLTVKPGTSRTIALVLCEGYWSEAGKRIQVLSVEGAEDMTVDPVVAYGKNKAGVCWFEASDRDQNGLIEIRVAPALQASDKNTILNGLWVFQAGTTPDDQALLTGKLNSKAQADIIHPIMHWAERSDYILVQVTNTSAVAISCHPKLFVNSTLPCWYEVDEQQIVVNGSELVKSSLAMADEIVFEDSGKLIQLEALEILPGESQSFFIQYTNGFSGQEKKETVSLAQVEKMKHEAIDFWENNPLIPFKAVQVPDPEIQTMIESSVRNIWQAREIKQGLPAFQVGPTCYRGLWIVDGAFLLEAATILGAGDQARNGVAYELTTQKEDGRIQSLAHDFWKENGIVLWTCYRHARLTQDEIWLESIWPRLERIAEFIKTLRQQTYSDNSPLNDGLTPPGTIDGGIGGTHDEYTNTYWNLTGLKAFVDAARWLGKEKQAEEWQKEYDDYLNVFKKAAARDLSKDQSGNSYLPILIGAPGKKQLPQRAQWAFCQAVYPGQIFSSDDPLVLGNMRMLQATEKEGMVYGTGWDATGIWNYFASFYAHAWLWQGNGTKAADLLYAFGNHAAPTYVWREEQSLKGAKFRKVGDMPHNWASAEFIRLTVHLLALDRGNDLHLFEGLPKEWLGPGMITRLNEIATPFGKLSLELAVAEDGQSATLKINPLSDPSCQNIIVHLDSFGQDKGQVIRLNPDEKNQLTIDVSLSN